MPELHKLTPVLGVLQDRGHKVALLTDGRMSGASGKVPAAIHMTPEATDGGADRKDPRRRHHPARLRRRHADLHRRRARVLLAHAGDRGPPQRALRHGPRIVRGVPRAGRHGGSRGERAGRRRLTLLRRRTEPGVRLLSRFPLATKSSMGAMRENSCATSSPHLPYRRARGLHREQRQPDDSREGSARSTTPTTTSAAC